MGAFLNSLSVRTGDADAVRARVVRWMSAKGYDLRPEAPYFPVDGWGLTLSGESGGDERGLFLVWNAEWTVLLYSHMLAEGPRLLWELGRDPAPVLETWVHDSDLWGYKLHRDGELLAEFNSNPRYFGAEEPSQLPGNGDPVLLCATCGLDGLEGTVAALQRARATFIEGVCQRFCSVIGAPAAGHGYRDLSELGLDRPGTQALGEFQAEHLYFVRRGQVPEPPPDLHRLPLRPPPPPEAGEQPEVSAEALAAARRAMLLPRILSYLLWPLGWLVVFLLRVWFSWRGTSLAGLLYRGRRTADEDAFTRALLVASRSGIRQDGRHVLNERYRFRVTLPEGVELMGTPGSSGLALFTVLGQRAYYQAFRADRIEGHLQPRAGVEVVEDEKFFLGPLPARRLLRQAPGPHGRHTQHLYVVQTPNAFLCFALSAQGDIPAEAPALLRELVNSFTLVDEEGTAQG